MSEYLGERSRLPMTEPDQKGTQRKLSMEIKEFNNTCDSIDFGYAFGKGAFVNFKAAPAIFIQMTQYLEEILKGGREKTSRTWEHGFGNRPASFLTIGRRDDGMPFMHLKGTTKDGQERQKMFMWFLPKGYNILINGQPASDVEKSERTAGAFYADAKRYVDELQRRYKPFVFQQGGNNYGGGGNNNNNGGGGGYGNNQQPAPATDDIDSMF